MAFNPVKLFQLKPLWGKFKREHPKFPEFLKAAQDGIEEGTVIEITVTTPEARTISSNIKLTASDMESVETLRETFSK